MVLLLGTEFPPVRISHRQHPVPFPPLSGRLAGDDVCGDSCELVRPHQYYHQYYGGLGHVFDGQKAVRFQGGGLPLRPYVPGQPSVLLSNRPGAGIDGNHGTVDGAGDSLVFVPVSQRGEAGGKVLCRLRPVLWGLLCPRAVYGSVSPAAFGPPDEKMPQASHVGGGGRLLPSDAAHPFLCHRDRDAGGDREDPGGGDIFHRGGIEPCFLRDWLCIWHKRRP